MEWRVGKEFAVELAILQLNKWEPELGGKDLDKFAFIDVTVFNEDSPVFSVRGLFLQIKGGSQVGFMDVPELHKERADPDGQMVFAEGAADLLVGYVTQILNRIDKGFVRGKLGLYPSCIGELVSGN